MKVGKVLRRAANFSTFMPFEAQRRLYKSSVASFTFIFATGTFLQVAFESVVRYKLFGSVGENKTV